MVIIAGVSGGFFYTNKIDANKAPISVVKATVPTTNENSLPIENQGTIGPVEGSTGNPSQATIAPSQATVTKQEQDTTTSNNNKIESIQKKGQD